MIVYINGDMMNKKVLVAYGTYYGSTKDVAERIGKVIDAEKGIEADVRDLAEDIGDISSYDGVVVGSGIKVGKWTEGARRFLERHSSELSKKDMPVGAFVCCGLAITQKDKATKQYIDDILEEYGVRPDLKESFGGLYDLSKKSKVNWIERFIVNIASRMMGNGDTKLDQKGVNDFRDWDNIEGFASRFAKRL